MAWFHPYTGREGRLARQERLTPVGCRRTPLEGWEKPVALVVLVCASDGPWTGGSQSGQGTPFSSDWWTRKAVDG